MLICSINISVQVWKQDRWWRADSRERCERGVLALPTAVSTQRPRGAQVTAPGRFAVGKRVSTGWHTELPHPRTPNIRAVAWFTATFAHAPRSRAHVATPSFLAEAEVCWGSLQAWNGRIQANPMLVACQFIASRLLWLSSGACQWVKLQHQTTYSSDTLILIIIVTCSKKDILLGVGQCSR